MKPTSKLKRLEQRQEAWDRSQKGKLGRSIGVSSDNFHKPGSLKK